MKTINVFPNRVFTENLQLTKEQNDSILDEVDYLVDREQVDDTHFGWITPNGRSMGEQTGKLTKLVVNRFASEVTPLFNTGSFTTSNPYHPDFVVKDASKDGTAHQSTGLEFYKYNSSNPTYQNAVNSGSYLIEKYIVPSGSTLSNTGYLSTRKMNYMMTPTKQVLLEDKDELPLSEAPKLVLSGDRFQPTNALLYSSVSGSEIQMFDGSTKQVQDVQV